MGQIFLKISFRHLWQSRLYSLINIIGLSTAIACMLLAVLYWKDERSYDDFHKNNPNLYRITTTLIKEKGSNVATVGGTGQVQGPAFKEAVPEVKEYVRVMGGDIYSDVIADSKTLQLQTLFVDEPFFNVFSFPLLRGYPQNVLKEINSVVITESTARKLYNSIDVIGKFITMDADPSFKRLGKPLMISGVVKDPPKNSSLQFDALLTFKFLHLSFDDTNWLNAYLGTFVVLHPGASIPLVTEKFNKVYAFHAKEQLAKNKKTFGYDPQINYGLQSIRDIHLNPLMRGNGSVEDGIINGSNPVYSYLFMGIALFILLMAAINFTNISIANSLKRSKEVGVRKIAGGSKWQIMRQFLSESAILCFVAFILSLIVVQTSLPLFNRVTGKQLLLAEAVNITLILYFITVLLFIILVSGIYPAYVLSNFKPSEVLYNKQKLSGRNIPGRSLVVLQFSLAIFLLIATIIYYSQMDYIRTKDLGYNPNGIIKTRIYGDKDYKAVTNILKNELAKEPSIRTVSFGNEGHPEDIYVNEKSFKAQYKSVDENFVAALEVPLQAGRNLSSSFASDVKGGAMVNEAFVKASGMTEPIGQIIKVNQYYDSANKTIRGVVKDFHFGSLREPIKPMVMYMDGWQDGDVWIKFEKRKQKEAMKAIEGIYRKVLPSAVYKYNFLDELNARQYVQEQRWQQVVNVATTISFIICCLGLFGLAHLSTNRRIKEMGIRKVLGASINQIIVLLSGDFLKLVMIAFVVAAPIAWIVMDNWLQEFAYRIKIGWWVFLLAGFLGILIAFVTVSFQAIRTGMANPVKSLRTE